MTQHFLRAVIFQNLALPVVAVAAALVKIKNKGPITGKYMSKLMEKVKKICQIGKHYAVR